MISEAMRRPVAVAVVALLTSMLSAYAVAEGQSNGLAPPERFVLALLVVAFAVLAELEDCGCTEDCDCPFCFWAVDFFLLVAVG